MKAISAVNGPRRQTISATLSERKNERPRSPRNMSAIQLRYWTMSGSLRPSSAMKLARSASLSLV